MNADRLTGFWSYVNWKAAENGERIIGTQEYQLYSDAYIKGQIEDGLGPYKILNSANHASSSAFPRPALILRADVHTKDVDLSEINFERTDYKQYHGGWPEEEIAALLSLIMGARIKAGGISRKFVPGEDPKGKPYYVIEEPPLFLRQFSNLMPYTKGGFELPDSSYLSTFPQLDHDTATALIKAARMYQDALWISESETALAWILFVSAVEPAAKHWCSRMQSGERFRNFILEFPPDPPENRPSADYQLSWKPEDLENTMKIVYKYRNKALHHGIPFPYPMCSGQVPQGGDKYHPEVPIGLASGAKGGMWLRKDAPLLLHTFEYIVRNALLNWWSSMVPDSS